MPSEFETVVESGQVQCLYCALILFAIVLIWYYSAKLSGVIEHLEQQDQIYTAGATMRFAQELSATDQVPYSTGYNFERMKLVDVGKKN